MDVELAPHEQRMVEEAARFGREVVAPRAAGWERRREVPLDTFRQAAEAGLCRLLAPASLGGHDLGVAATAAVLEELAYADMAFAFTLVVHNNLVRTLTTHGSEALVGEHLPSLLDGSCVGAFLLTEPTAGSDAAAITTTARRDGDGWVLDGEKAWITNAAVAGLLSVYAQTDRSAGGRGIGCFLVDAGQSGVVRQPAYDLLGAHAMGTGGFRFEGCRVDGGQVLIPPGEALRAALSGIDVARVMVAAMCVGMLRCGLDVALERVRERRAFGQRLADFQGLQWMLAEVATDLEAARALAGRAARTLDAGATGGDATLAAAHAKKLASRVALTRLSDCMQLLGASGFSHDHPLARHLAGAKMAQYLDGTTEIQNVVIARHLLA